MVLQLDLQNSANWEQVWTISKNAVVNPNGYGSNYYPMPEIAIPLLLDSPVVAIFASSSTAKATWKSAGYAYQRVGIGVTVGGATDADLGESRHVVLDRIAIAIWSRVTNNYELTFTPRRWLNQLTLIVWKYNGPIIDSSIEAIGLTRIDVLRTEQIAKMLLEEVRDG